MAEITWMNYFTHNNHISISFFKSRMSLFGFCMIYMLNISFHISNISTQHISVTRGCFLARESLKKTYIPCKMRRMGKMWVMSFLINTSYLHSGIKLPKKHLLVKYTVSDRWESELAKIFLQINTCRY